MLTVVLLALALTAGQEIPLAPYSPVPAGERRAPPLLPPLPPPPVVDPTHPPKVIERPTWARKPTGDAVARVYPDRAMLLSIPGRAVVQCQVRLTGTLEGCGIVEETPAGMGFGAAVLRLTSSFRMTPMRHDGVEVDGAVVRIPIAFSPPGIPPWEGEFTLSQAIACAGWHKARLEILPGDAESVRGLERFSTLTRQLGKEQEVSDKVIESALAGAIERGVPDPSSICHVAV